MLIGDGLTAISRLMIFRAPIVWKGYTSPHELAQIRQCARYAQRDAASKSQIQII
jgi:hypothetical protein